MSKRFNVKPLIAFLACQAAIPSHAAVWDENLAGDLSNTGLTPTSLVFAIGANQVLGSVGNSGQGVDRDYFKFTVPPGATLTSLKLLGNTSVSGSASFLALQAGPQVTVTPSGVGVENLLGFTHYGTEQIGTDILPLVVFNNFSGALPGGTYSVWLQETGGQVDYGLEFGIVPAVDNSADVPTLPEWALLLLVTLLLAATWRSGGRPGARAPNG
jgi:hypothetical protein